MAGNDSSPRLVIRVKRGDRLLLGPGRVELLEKIEETGSISAAARAMRMSYRRAWLLVESMNQGFPAGVVETAQGGSRGGGTRLTETGRALVRAYRRIEARAARAASAEVVAIRRLATSPPTSRRHARG